MRLESEMLLLMPDKGIGGDSQVDNKSQNRLTSQQEKEDRPISSVKGVELPLPSQGKELGEQMGK
jgi:hypothetical protein